VPVTYRGVLNTNTRARKILRKGGHVSRSRRWWVVLVLVPVWPNRAGTDAKPMENGAEGPSVRRTVTCPRRPCRASLIPMRSDPRDHPSQTRTHGPPPGTHATRASGPGRVSLCASLEMAQASCHVEYSPCWVVFFFFLTSCWVGLGPCPCEW
jgi:hypothetical protein